MVAISFYQPGKVNCSLPFPQEWNELLPQELECISHHQLTDHASTGEAKACLLRDLIGIRAWYEGRPLPDNWFQRLDAEDATVNGLPLLDFLFGENTLIKQPYPVLTVPNPRFGVPGRFRGPDDDFNNLTAGEFEDCEIFFHQFRETPGPEPLARLAAILYRPHGVPYITYNSRRDTYHTYNIEDLLPRFLALDEKKLFTIFTWYTGCRQRLPQLFATAFESDGDEKEEPDAIAFTKCIHGAAGPKNGTRNQVRMTLLKELFLEIELEAQKAKEMRRQYESIKR